MNTIHPSEQGGNGPNAGTDTGPGPWVLSMADHWKGALVIAAVAGAAAFAADNPLQRSSQVSFLLTPVSGAPGVTGDTIDLARMLGAAGVDDGDRWATVTAKSERESGIVATSFTLQRTVDSAEARSIAEGLVKQATAAIGPQVEAARGSIEASIRVRQASLDGVTALLGGPGPSSAPTEAQAMLLSQQSILRAEISDAERRLAGIRLPAILGEVRVAAGRSWLRAWSAPIAAFAVAFLAAPLAIRTLAEARRAVAAARRP